MYNIDKEVNKMADIRISPQGYVYGEEPLSDHPFWEDGPAGADQYVKEVTGTSTTEGTVTTYDIKYTDQDDVEHDVIAIPVDSAGGGSGGVPTFEAISRAEIVPWYGMRIASAAYAETGNARTTADLSSAEAFLVFPTVNYGIIEGSNMVNIDVSLELTATDLGELVNHTLNTSVYTPATTGVSTKKFHFSKEIYMNENNDSYTVQFPIVVPVKALSAQAATTGSYYPWLIFGELALSITVLMWG